MDNQGQASENTTKTNGMDSKRATTMIKGMISMRKRHNICRGKINGLKEDSITEYLHL